MFRKKWFWIVLIVLLLLAGGGYVAYARGVIPWFTPQQAAEEEPTMQTATVTVGNLSITADGTGVLVPSSEVDLAFGASGTLMELLVEVGDRVEAGEVLAWIDDTDARNAVVEAELSVLQAEEALENAQDTAQLEQAVAQAGLKLAQTEADLAAAETDLDDLLNWAPDETEVEIAQANLAIAQADYQIVATKVGMRSLTTSIATEIGPDAGVWLFSFAPGIVDTPLVNNYFYSELAGRFGMTMPEIIASIGGNPGYEGLMPAEHCGASLASYIVSARQYHGQLVNPFLPLAKAEVIDFGTGLQTDRAEDLLDGRDGFASASASLREYIKSVTGLNRSLEHSIEVRTRELTHANEELKVALDNVKQLSGLLPICSFCKNVRDDKGYWNRIEKYIQEHSEAQFSHSVCSKCAKKHYPHLGFDEK